MSEDRYDKFLNAAIILLIASATVLGYSVYKSQFSKPNLNANIVNTAVIDNLRDSLKNVYANTVTSIDTNRQRTTTETNPELELKYREVESLKAEISQLLGSKGEGDVANAQQKIIELQQRVETLQISYKDVEAENKRLQATLNQLKNSTSGAGKNTTTAPSINSEPDKSVSSNSNSNFKTTSPKAAEMRFFATKSDGETNTTKASDADKFVGNFVFKLPSNKISNDDIYIVVIQPNGSTIKGASWDIGVFDSDEGKKVFTKKIPLSIDGLSQKVNFTLAPDEFMKGTYTVEIWYQKNLIGRVTKSLI